MMPYAGHVCVATYAQQSLLWSMFANCKREGQYTAQRRISVLMPALHAAAHHDMCFVSQVIECKARRCFYVAHAYLASGKQLEAHALFGRAAQHAKLAAKHHQVCTLHACISGLQL